MLALLGLQALTETTFVHAVQKAAAAFECVHSRCHLFIHFRSLLPAFHTTRTGE